MGTDVHIHIEYRSRKTKRYKYGGEIHVLRNYCIFDVMSGFEMQNAREALFPVRGLPGDVTIATSSEHRQWKGDAHHTSWLTTIEFAACIVEAYIRMNSIEQLRMNTQYEDIFILLNSLFSMDTKHDDDTLWDYKELLDVMLDYEKNNGECRIVFWFDN